MSVAIIPKSHNAVIGYVLAKIDGRQMYLYETIERAKKAALLNIQSYNARYNARVKREKIAISDFQNVDFHSIGLAQQAKAIDAFLYNSDCAKTYYSKNCLSRKLIKYRETLEFDEFDYNACQWFICELPVKEPKSHDEFVADYELIHCVSYRK